VILLLALVLVNGPDLPTPYRNTLCVILPLYAARLRFCVPKLATMNTIVTRQQNMQQFSQAQMGNRVTNILRLFELENVDLMASKNKCEYLMFLIVI
jgi:hypothetical protein